jgi:hypothetical protein
MYGHNLISDNNGKDNKDDDDDDTDNKGNEAHEDDDDDDDDSGARYLVPMFPAVFSAGTITLRMVG